MIGNGLVVAADGLAEVQAFNRSNPLAKAGLRRIISIPVFNKRVDHHA